MHLKSEQWRRAWLPGASKLKAENQGGSLFSDRSRYADVSHFPVPITRTVPYSRTVPILLILAAMFAAGVICVSCAAGYKAPAALPAPANPAERMGPWDITVALYDPALFGPERPLADLVAEARLPLDKGKLKDARLLANKAQRRLELWVGKEMVKAYRVQLGIYPHGPKTRRGDKRTPEGMYFICAHTPSEFYLALWISYPNLDDAQRGLKSGLIAPMELEAIAAALSRGKCPPQGTNLGGDLVIHGEIQAGNTDPARVREYQDWTDGCIALFNPDMRELYEFVPDGTPLVIVANGPVTAPLAVAVARPKK